MAGLGAALIFTITFWASVVLLTMQFLAD